MNMSPAKPNSSLVAAYNINQIEQHSGRSSFIWLVTDLPGAVVFIDIVADIAAAIKVTGALFFEQVKGGVL